MSLHISVISIEGNHVADMPSIFRQCDYVLNESLLVVRSSQEALQHLEDWVVQENCIKKVVFFADGWTHVLDPELVMMSEEDVWLGISAGRGRRVLCWVCEGASGTYGFSLYENGRKRRAVCYSDGQLEEDEGDLIPEEVGIRWDEAFEDDVLQVAEQLEAPFDDWPDETDYHVYVLDELHLDAE